MAAATTDGDGPPPLAPLAPAATPITAVLIPAAEEEDELEALIPQAPAPAAGGGEEEDELLAAYRDLQSSQGQQGQQAGEEDEAPPEALDARALMARCEGRLRRIEAALGEYEVGWVCMCVDGWGYWIRGWFVVGCVGRLCVCCTHLWTCTVHRPIHRPTHRTRSTPHHHRRHRARGWRRSGRGWRTRTQPRSPSAWFLCICIYSIRVLIDRVVGSSVRV